MEPAPLVRRLTSACTCTCTAAAARTVMCRVEHPDGRRDHLIVKLGQAALVFFGQRTECRVYELRELVAQRPPHFRDHLVHALAWLSVRVRVRVRVCLLRLTSSARTWLGLGLGLRVSLHRLTPAARVSERWTRRGCQSIYPFAGSSTAREGHSIYKRTARPPAARTATLRQLLDVALCAHRDGLCLSVGGGRRRGGHTRTHAHIA